MKSRFTMIVAVHLLLIDKDNNLLLSRRFQTGYEDGNYSVPAGHVEEGESCLTAMAREAKEEIGIEIEEKNLQLAHIMHRSTDRESIDFFFCCRKWGGEPQNCETQKCDEICWCELTVLPSNTIPYIRQAIQGYIHKELYSQVGI